MSFRRRTFPEVLDAVLTHLVGGVAAEAHPFPPPGANSGIRHVLEKPPVEQVVSVYGSRDGQPRLFRTDIDYRLEDQQTLTWQTGAELPDPGTLILVNYLPAGVQPPLTDLQVGSVVRTVAETVALEIARLSAQLEGVYRSGFIDTASGSALDKVVALLGLERVPSGRATGEIQFARAPGARGTITIPAGTRVMTPSGDVEYQTTATVTMAEAQGTIRVTARDLEDNGPLAADSLTVLPVPIAGIATVTNPAPTGGDTPEESDQDLRARAKNVLHGSERATLGALRQAIARQQITADVEERAGQPGYVDITPHAATLPPELQQRLLTAIQDARPAGVVVTLKGAEAPKRVNLELRLTTATGLTEQDLRAAQRAVRDKVEDYFARLPAREAGSINRLVGAILSVPEVQDVKLLEARLEGGDANLLNAATGLIEIGGFPTILGELHIADPQLPTLLGVVVTFPPDEEPPNAPSIEAALSEALSYLNELNARELGRGASAAERSARVLSFGKLLRVIPLPGKPGESLRAFDEAPVPPALPDENSIAPYRVTFALTVESGLTRVLTRAADEPFTLTPFERLSQSGVEVVAEAADG